MAGREMLVKMKRRIVDVPRHMKARVRRKSIARKLCERYDVKGKIERNIVLVSVDCLRADFVDGKTMPFLSSVKGARFVNAKTPSTWTWPSVASLITGRYPEEHGAAREDGITSVKEGLMDKIKGTMGVKGIRDDVLSLPEVFEYLGAKTYFNAGSILFAEYVTEGRYTVHRDGVGMHAEDIVNEAIGFMNAHESFFVHLHLGDPHEPIYAPEKYRELFDAPFDEEHRRWKYKDGRVDDNFEEYREGKLSLYRAALRYVDDALHALYEYVKERGDTVLIITSDHGEEFWEHAEMEKEYFYDPRGFYGVGHGHTVFHELTDVPLIITGEGVRNGEYESPVSTAGVFAFVLDAAGVEHAIPCLLSVFEWRGSVRSGHMAYGYDKKAWWEGKHKYVVSEKDGVYWRFDVEKDPEEKNPEELT